ncbi:MAG: hypothetical protein JW976_01615, partial [Syntrophaceae bacterium]|nr:hypothetical protein [Syntrophaceae bacterium]
IGAVEVVRIVKDQTTSGTLAFTNINQTLGTLAVNLIPEMADVLDVSIIGSAATKSENQSMALSAEVSNYSDNVTYVWYVNGDAVATGVSYDFGESFAQGYYRVDVTAFSADGKCAGSATSMVQVVASVAGNVTQTDVIYIAQDAQGTDSGNEPGNAHGVIWFNDPQNWSIEEKEDGLIGPKDVVYLCGTITSPAREQLLTIQGSGTLGSPITVMFAYNARLTSPCFEADPGCHTGGAIHINNKEHIIIDGGENGIIENTDTGQVKTYFRSNPSEGICNMTGTIGILINKSKNIEIKNIRLQDLYISDGNTTNLGYPDRNGEVGAWTNSIGICCTYSDNIKVHDNFFSHIGIGINVNMTDNSGYDISNNEAHNTAAFLFSGGTTSIDGTNIDVHHNTISDTTPWAYNDGIKFFGKDISTEPYKGIKIHDNTIGPKISQYPKHPATAWIVVDQGWIIEPEIYNNLLIGDENDNAANGYIIVGGYKPSQNLGWLEQNSKIYNNTIISEYPGRDIAIMLGKNSSGHSIINNTIEFKGDLCAIYYHQADQLKIDVCDNNNYSTEGDLFFTFGYTTMHIEENNEEVWTTTYSNYSLEEWQNEFGFDMNSSTH